ncbi:transposase [Calothrix sp. 336/3]|uniref:transposase n=1 Tax=Calothrix sp. 336/3 TaxID=1337936 RepID=UPI0004E382C7|nr:transposase [Calothrix sp. 336/3]AKG22342.1 transposase [Calothrix sp. 336/3]
MRKLTETDKKEILKLYRETAETTSTLAERYDVSNSTISRLLKSTLAEEEYEYLVSLKRAARTPEGRAQVSYEHKPPFIEPEEAPQPEKKLPPTPVVIEPPPEVKVIPAVASESSPSRRVKKRISSTVKPIPVGEQLELPVTQELVSIPSPILEDTESDVGDISYGITSLHAEMLGEDLLDEGDDLDDLDDDFDDDDDEDYEEDEIRHAPPLVTRSRSGDGLVRVLPLSSAHLPRTCYLVIDRAAELITRPLRDFGDLGHIPGGEIQERTLPVFDNHRVAKRFSTKRDRVIKVPDSRMLQKARYHLQAKGITRLLIDGQVYSM